MIRSDLEPLIGLKYVLRLIVILILSNSCLSRSIPGGLSYLGQAPPGDTPKIFPLSVNPGFFAAERIAVSNDGKDIYYSEIKAYYPVRGESIKRYSFSGGKWASPVNLFEGFIAPCLSISGDTMYVQRDSETYISVKSKVGWTVPVRILSDLDSAHYYQVTAKGNQYVSSIPEKGEGGFEWCKVTHGSVSSAISLGRPLNTGTDNLDFFIARDESFIITTRQNGLSVSFRMKDGSWCSPLNLGPEINFGLGMWGPFVSRDNKYLFYSTGTKPDYSDVYIYWVRIDKIIERMRQTLSQDWNMTEGGQ